MQIRNDPLPIARHDRGYEHEAAVFDLLHDLPLLAQRFRAQDLAVIRVLRGSPVGHARILSLGQVARMIASGGH
jgi:hypothetical protein